MRDATIAGRKAFLAGRMPKKLYASASLSSRWRGARAMDISFDWSIVCAAKSRRDAEIEEVKRFLAPLGMTAGKSSLTLRSWNHGCGPLLD